MTQVLRGVAMATARCWAQGGPEDTDGTSGKPSGLEQKPDLQGACAEEAHRLQPLPHRKQDGCAVTPATTAGATLDPLEALTPTFGDISFLAGKPCSVFLMKLQATKRRGGGK